MVYNLYATHNLLSRTYETIYPYTTDEMAQKYVVKALVNVGRDVSEYELKRVATYDEETGNILPAEHYIVKLPDPASAANSTPNSNPQVDKTQVYLKGSDK